MGLLSKFENKMEDGIEGAAGALGRSSLSPVQITKKAEKQMRREKIVGAGKQYAPTLYTVLVSPEDDSKLFKYYPTLAGETETYLMAKAREMGYVMDGQPLVRFLSDPQLKKGKFEVVAEMVAASIIDQLRDDEMKRYGLPTAGARRHVSAAQRERNLQPNMQPLPVREPEPDAYQGGYVEGAVGAQPQMPYNQSMPPMQTQQPYADPAMADPAYGQPQPMSAAEMNVPSVLGSQVSAVPQQPYAARGAHTGSKNPRPSIRKDSVDPNQIIDDLQIVEQVGAEVAADGANGSPIVVMPALSENLNGAGVPQGSGVDAIFGDGGSASTVDIESRQSGAAQNVFLYDEARDRAYKLTGDRQNIGRESANEIVVPDINISRVHAEIHMQPNGQWVVTDLGSTNGLYVNGQKVQSAVLKDADMITVGTSTLEFQHLA